MPQADERLRRKFMKEGSDGIAEAEEVIKKAGGYIRKGRILIDELIEDQEVVDAVGFLCDEWDYDVVELNRDHKL